MPTLESFKRETSVNTYQEGYTVDVLYTLEYEGIGNSVDRYASVRVRVNFLDADNVVTIADAKAKAVVRAREILADVQSLEQANRLSGDSAERPQ